MNEAPDFLPSGILISERTSRVFQKSAPTIYGNIFLVNLRAPKNVEYSVRRIERTKSTYIAEKNVCFFDGLSLTRLIAT